jgi:hypothetical protein
MKRIALLLITLVVFGFSDADEQQAGKGFLSDFTILVTSLKELQPCLYKNISKEEFDRQVQIVSERLLKTPERNKAIYIIQEFFYKLGNSHAGNVSIYGDAGTMKSLPMNFYIVQHHLYIKNFPSDTSYNGTRVLSIQGTKAETLIDSLKIFFLRDGVRETMDPNLQCYFNNLYGIFCSQPDTFHITTEKGKITAPALQRGTPLFNEIVLHNSKSYFGTDEERILTKKTEKDYAYFRFKNFQEKIRKVEIKKNYLSFIHEITEKHVPNLIIDLRDNNGGEAQLSCEMASWLSDHDLTVFTNSYITLTKRPSYLDSMNNKSYFRRRELFSYKQDTLRKYYRFMDGNTIASKKNRYKGHIYILISPYTQSASSLFCSYLYGQSNVTFVGDDTNGAINFFWAGNFFSSTLPHLKTDYEFGVELLEFRKNSVRTEAEQPVIPDVKIIYTIDDILNRRDLEMEWVKNDIQKKDPLH